MINISQMRTYSQSKHQNESLENHVCVFLDTNKRNERSSALKIGITLSNLNSNKLFLIYYSTFLWLKI